MIIAEEANSNAQIIVELSDENKLIAYHPESREGLLYKFDNCFDSETSNNTIFETICVPLLDAVIEGYNGTIISYGSSRTGKTEMLIGNEREEGIVDLTFREGYSHLASISDPKVHYQVSFSFWEMSNDTIIDLLDSNEEKVMKIKKNPESGNYISNLSEFEVESWEQLQNLIDNGIRRSQKMTASRQIRLHSFMRLRLTKSDENPEQNLSSTLMFVNLKGTERIGKMGVKGEHLKEGASINKSMASFGNAIHNIVNHTKVRGNKDVNVSSLFGDSQVTAMLGESLGGKCATVLLGTISQTEFHYLETMEALENLRIARHIATKPKKQVLKTEILKLHRKIKELESKIPEDNLAPGHPPTDQQEELEQLKMLQRKYINGIIEEEDLKKPIKSDPHKNEKVEIPDMSIPKDKQLWKQNNAKSQRHGPRATVYKPKSGDAHQETYKGSWKEHKKHGFGELDSAKWKYHGHWANDKKEGRGTLYNKEKSKRVYNGEWKEDKKHGSGIFYYENGEIYDGEWQNDRRNGYGVMYYLDGTKYEGEWREDLQSGKGVKIEKNGDRFEGTYFNGLKHGPGTFYYVNAGQKYVGEWFKGVPKCGQLFTDVELDENVSDQIQSKDIPENKLMDSSKVIEDAVTAVRIQMEREGCLPSNIRENMYE